jgi:hypothetical protein
MKGQIPTPALMKAVLDPKLGMLKVDIVEGRDVAELFEVVGIPIAVAVTAEGDEIGGIENFVEPPAFGLQLKKWHSETKRDLRSSK